MNFPKKLMKLTELQEMGFEKTYLLYLSSRKDQRFCWKMSPKKNSPYLFDTEELDKYIQRQIETQRNAQR